MTIRLPGDPSDFQPSEQDRETSPTPACSPARTFRDPQAPSSALVIRLFRVDVRFQADMDTAVPQPLTQEFSDVAERAWHEGAVLADSVAHDFLRWARSTSQQPWLGIIAEPPAQYGRSGLFDALSGEGVMGFGPLVQMTWRSALLSLDAGALDTVMVHVTAADEVPVARALLADARHLGQGADVQDAQRSVLLAAIACEVHAKQVLRDRVHPSRRELMELMLTRRSNVADLVDAVMKAGFGVSVRETHPALHSRVQQLIKTRNAVVHAGHAVSPEEVDGACQPA